MEVLHGLAVQLETTVDALFDDIESRRRYFVYCRAGALSRLVRGDELGGAIAAAQSAGVDVRTVEIMDLGDVPDNVRRAAAAELN